MKTRFFRSRAIGKVFLVLLFALLAFQGSGINGLAAPASQPGDLQEQETYPLTCECPSVTAQIVLLIDDSGSMQSNDRGEVRNQLAIDLVNKMFDSRGDRDSRLKDLQIGVIHFSNEVNQNTPTLINVTQKISENGSDIDGLRTAINWKPTDKQTTNFAAALSEANKLFTDGDCTHQSIVLFTDGAPEDLTGRFTGQKLADLFSTLSSYSKDVPGLDGIYLIGFKDNANYLSETAKTGWTNFIRNWSDLNTKLSTSQAKVPRFYLYSSQELNAQLNPPQKPAGSNPPDSKPTLKINFDELLKYQTLNVAFDSNLSQFKEGDTSTIQFNLVDASGKVVMPGGDLSQVLILSDGSSPALTWDVSVKPLTEHDALEKEENGNDYTFSWTPESSGIIPIQIAYTLADGQADKLLDCAGIVNVNVASRTSTIVENEPPIKTTLVIGSPQFPDDETVTFPMQLNYDGNNEPATSIDWDASASSVDGSLTASVSPDSATPGMYFLTVKPIGDAEEIQAVVKPTIKVDGKDIRIPDTPTSAQLACVYDPAWNIWFWILGILFAGALVILLALRAVDKYEQKDYEVAETDGPRVRKWRFTFTSLLILLGFLVLNKLWWCYTIPWWLFFVSLLGLFVVTVTLVHFIKDESRRNWVLLALLLVAVGVIAYVSIRVDRDLLWPLVVALLLTVIGRWYIRPDEQPDEPKPQHETAAVMRLVSVPACAPYNETIRIPLRFDYENVGKPMPSLTWEPSVVVLPEVSLDDMSAYEREKKPMARIEPVDAVNGKYELVIDPVKYDKGTTQVQVKVRASATDLADGHAVQVPDETITIGLCPPDNLADLEGVGPAVMEFLYENQILTFKQLAKTDAKELKELLDAKPWDTADAKTRPPGSKPWKMMDAKTWPQQAKLVAIAKELGNDDEIRNFKAYKDWLKDGIEPDEREVKEEQRRPAPALPWNGIPQFTPVLLRLGLNSSENHHQQVITLPIWLNNEGDQVRLAKVDWEVSARALPGGIEAETAVIPIDSVQGAYELVITPPAQNEGRAIADQDAREVLVKVNACVNGRSIEIYYGKAISIQVAPPALPPDNLEEIEGIGHVYNGILNENKIYTFSQLAGTAVEQIMKWLSQHDYEYEDPKTWPQQAKLASIAKYGNPADKKSYIDYKDWLDRGIEPDERDKDKKDRRKEALVWHGTAELTENAYPEIFER